MRLHAATPTTEWPHDNAPEPLTAGSRRPASDVDVLVVGAGITGIYQLYRAREAGFSAQLVEAGGGVGGTWYWNRYPGARFDSESYTYGYLFSQELFDEWEWQEHFAAQPETERYLNHVVDRFDLRRHMRFDAPVTAAVFDEPSGTWDVTLGDGHRRRPCAPGSSSPPPACCRCRTSPTCPGATTSAACSTTPAGGRPTRRLRRQAGGGRRHLVERRAGGADDPRRGRVAHRVPAHRQLVHAAEQHADHRRRAGAAPGRLRGPVRGAQHVDQRLRPPGERAQRRSTTRRGRAAGLLREDVDQPGLHEAHEQLRRPAVQRGGQRRVVRVHRRQDPRHRGRPGRRPSG